MAPIEFNAAAAAAEEAAKAAAKKMILSESSQWRNPSKAISSPKEKKRYEASTIKMFKACVKFNLGRWCVKNGIVVLVNCDELTESQKDLIKSVLHDKENSSQKEDALGITSDDHYVIMQVKENGKLDTYPVSQSTFEQYQLQEFDNLKDKAKESLNKIAEKINAKIKNSDTDDKTKNELFDFVCSLVLNNAYLKKARAYMIDSDLMGLSFDDKVQVPWWSLQTLARKTGYVKYVICIGDDSKGPQLYGVGVEDSGDPVGYIYDPSVTEEVKAKLCTLALTMCDQLTRKALKQEVLAFARSLLLALAFAFALALAFALAQKSKDTCTEV